MPKPRTCPNCFNIVPLNRGFEFDDGLNMVCSGCKKSIVPRTTVGESNFVDPNYRYSQQYQGMRAQYSLTAQRFNLQQFDPTSTDMEI